MKTTISSKLFLGFLLVIFLNVFFVVVVSRFTDLYGIARVLGWQNEVKSGLRRVASLHGAQRTNFVILEKLGRRESYDNILRTDTASLKLLDTLDGLLGRIRAVDTVLAANANSWQIQVKFELLSREINQYIRAQMAAYRDSVSAFVVRSSAGPATDSTPRLPRPAVQAASDSLLVLLRSSEAGLDELTRQRLADIQTRITSASQTTTWIVIGTSVVALLFGFIFSRAITNSLRRLKLSMASVAKGDFGIDVSGYPEDEIGDLANSFGTMATDLRSAQQELAKRSRLSGILDLVASVNHEINNPLMIIAGNAQLLEMSLQDRPEELARLKTIVEETERISSVTRKLRDIRNPVSETYVSSSTETMLNLDKSSVESGKGA